MDTPQAGKIYALTGATGTPSIVNGNTWQESEIKERANAMEENSYSEKVLALARHLEIMPEFVDEKGNNLFGAEGGKNEWLVITDSEADRMEDEYLDNYIDDCILSELPKAYRCYFDDEKWKRDARMDGRGHSLAAYDGEENCETVNGTDYYIYRTN